MSFSYNLDNNIGKARFNAQDTNANSHAFTDEEVTYLLGLSGNDPVMTAYRMLMILASNKAKLAIKRSAGDYTEDLSQLPDKIREQAKALLEMNEIDPAEATAEMQSSQFAYDEFMGNQSMQESN